jgi:starvation-inducible outer membrane lipoprotein
MKYIFITMIGFLLSGCTTPFNEYYQPNQPVVQERSIVPTTLVEPKKEEKKEDDSGVVTQPIDLR